MGTRVTGVELQDFPSDLLIGRHIDLPVVGDEMEEVGIDVVGWVAGATEAVDEIVLTGQDRFWRTVPLGDSRPDLAAAFPEAPHAGRAGFSTRIGLRGMTRADVGIHAKLQDGTHIPLATIRLERTGSAKPPSLPPVGMIDLGDLRRVEPVSEEYGYERGNPIDRYYIEAFLEKYSQDIRGRTLEILDDTYSRRFGVGRVTEAHVLDIDPGNAEATIIADLTDAPDVPSDYFDAIIVTQTLHLIYEIRSAVRTLHRILAPGGTLLVTFPGISPIGHEQYRDTWSWALTPSSAKLLLGEFFGTDVDVESMGNVLTAGAFVYGLAQEDLLPADMDVRDPFYPVTVAVRAKKANAGPSHRRGAPVG